MYQPFDALNTLAKMTFSWTSDADGAAMITTSDDVQGTIVRITITPSAGDTAPSAAYDMTLTDEDGLEILSTNGANLSATASTHFWPEVLSAAGNPMPVVTASKLTLAVTNAGDGNKGLVKVFIKK